MLLTLTLLVWPVKMCTSTPKRAVVIKPCHATCNAEIQTCASGAQSCSAISRLSTFRGINALWFYFVFQVWAVLPPWRFWSSIIFLGCLLASSVTEIETFFGFHRNKFGMIFRSLGRFVHPSDFGKGSIFCFDSSEGRSFTERQR